MLSKVEPIFDQSQGPRYLREGLPEVVNANLKL